MLDEIPFRVGHAVVQHALGTGDARHGVDAGFDAVGGVLAGPAFVVFEVKGFLGTEERHFVENYENGIKTIFRTIPEKIYRH